MDWTVLDEIPPSMTSNDRIIEAILLRRGIDHQVDFLNASLLDLRWPFGLLDMMSAVKKIADRINSINDKRANANSIWVFGDYDADGITSSTILILGFRELGVDVNYYIPERSEGYGLNKEAIKMAFDSGCEMIITCDNGITAKEEVEYAKFLGMEVIVTDHHAYQENLAPDCTIVNPQQPGCLFSFKELSGAGVAFYLMRALFHEIEGNMQYANFLLPWVAIGTIADVMSLTEDNRIIVRNGLAMINECKNYGIRNLLKILDLQNKDVTAYDVGFKIGPVLNATGRLTEDKDGKHVSARRAVDMFLDTSRLRTYRTASELLELNETRKEMTADFTKKILEYIDSFPFYQRSKIMVVPYVGIPDGLVGLIAGRLKEAYQKPVLLITDSEDGNWKGSGRSIPKYHMFDELSQFKNFFMKFGGHEMACGFMIKGENLKSLNSVLNNLCPLTDDDLKPVKEIDFKIHPKFVTLDFAEALEDLEPFGKGNKKPSFVFFNAEVKKFRFIGKEQNHLSLTITKRGVTFNCIAFNMVEQFESLGRPAFIDLVFFPSINEWNGQRSLQLKIEDFRETEINT